MRTAVSIKAEMDSIQVSLSTGRGLTKQFIAKEKKRHSFLKLCKAYLEGDPAHEFIAKEKKRIQERIKLIDAGYKPNQRLIDAELVKEERKEHADYNKIMGMQKCKDQLKAINFLLG